MKSATSSSENWRPIGGRFRANQLEWVIVFSEIDLLAYLRSARLATVSSLGPDGAPQSALVGIGVTEDLRIIFDATNGARSRPSWPCILVHHPIGRRIEPQQALVDDHATRLGLSRQAVPAGWLTALSLISAREHGWDRWLMVSNLEL